MTQLGRRFWLRGEFRELSRIERSLLLFRGAILILLDAILRRIELKNKHPELRFITSRVFIRSHQENHPSSWVNYANTHFLEIQPRRLFGYFGGYIDEQGSVRRSDGLIMERYYPVSHVLDRLEYLEQKVIWIGYRTPYNFYHWIFDFVLPYLVWENENDENVKILFGFALCRWQKEWLRILGISNYTDSKSSGNYKTSKTVILFKKFTFNSNELILARNLLINRIRVRKQIFPSSGARNVFINRGVQARGGNCINYAEVCETLTEKGFFIFDPELASESEKIDLFMNAKTVIGIFGAGLTGIIFLPRGSQVIELKPSQYVNHPDGKTYSEMSRILGLNFSTHEFEEVNEQHDFIINQESLIKEILNKR